ncbi:thiamine diphosphokinase [Clostridium grantii]|uniref:Thiamine diphosphokinase n=1 Tax=Clostridium grantii DSM 8605 TaxID=1121316 RepID=A0A1M5QUE6_9CLOT|nr:thiamine diphosphokinase [Clostridium grantii]SHH17506.1 thiamine diphosphokinase [Clostridium grantii DSM 8605]
MKVLIISGGVAPSFSLLTKEINNADLIICADSGANHLYKHKIVPHYLVGDFDSINLDVLKFYENEKCNILKFPPEKDFTDSELAMNIAFENNAEEIVFLGCTGTRIDHFFGSLTLLYKSMKKGIKAFIKDNNNEIFMVDKSIIIKGSEKEKFSLMPYKNEIYRLNIKGSKYDLKDYNLKIGDGLTISNEFQEEKVTIEFEKGDLLIFFSRD